MRYIIISFIVFLSINLFAQENTWTLGKCIQHAFENNISIKQSELSQQIMQNNYSQSKIELLPSVDADVSQSFNFGNSVDPTTFEFVKLNTNSNSFGLSLSLPLFTGLQQINNIKRSKIDKEVAQQDLLSLKEQMSLTITTYFLNILLYQEVFASAMKQIETTMEQMDNTQKLIDAGALPQGDLLDIEAQMAEDELRAIQAGNNLQIARLSLQLLLQLEPNDNFSITAPTLTDPEEKLPPFYNPASLYNDAISRRPEIKAEEFRLESAEVSEKIAKGALYPSLSLNTSIRSNYFSETMDQSGSDSFFIPSSQIGFLEDDITEGVLSLPRTEYFPIFSNKSFGKQIGDNVTETVSLNLRIPIFQGWQRMTNVENAKLSKEISKYSLLDTKNKLREEINQAYANTVAALKTYISAKKAYSALEKSFNYAEEKYQLGTINSLDYLTVKNRLAISESDLLNAKYDYIFKLKILDFYAGNPISLGNN